ncbi:MAG: hypothetical protein PGN09_04300 [Sphingomonas fennica]
MKKFVIGAGLAAATFVAASPAAAQMDPETSWTGFYVGGRAGYSWQPNDNDERVGFDTNRDGNFNDTVTTATGANAFSPGFCGGLALTSARGAGCRADKNALEYAAVAGFDYQIGNAIVVGAVVDYGNSNVNDYLSGFSTTPANYTLSRGLRGVGTLRARAGYAFNLFTPEPSTLVYATGGGAYGRVRNRFTTTNTTNTFTNPNGSDARTEAWKDNVWGYTYGGGIEQKIGRFSIGAQYLFTALRDNDYTVNVAGGPAGNPFIRANAAGTQLNRQFRDFARHSVTVSTTYRF